MPPAMRVTVHFHPDRLVAGRPLLEVLIEEAIKEQNYDVDVVSSATVTSLAFQQTLFDALRQAKR